jgi:hypothetical protein
VPLCGLEPVRDTIAGVFNPHPTWTLGQMMLLDGLFLGLCLAMLASLKRTFDETLANEVAQPSFGRSAAGQIFGEVATLPRIKLVSSHVLTTFMAQVRHCSAGLFIRTNLPGLALLQMFMGLALAAYLHSRNGLQDRLAPVLCGEILLLQILASSDFLIAAPFLPYDALRPWTRHYWSWLIQAMLLWRKVALLSILWMACLVPWYLTHQASSTWLPWITPTADVPGSWLPWIAASYLIQPLLAACQSWQLSLRHPHSVFFGGIAMSAYMMAIMMSVAKPLLDQDAPYHISSLQWLLWLSLLAASDMLLIYLAHRRWLRLDLKA